LLIPYSFDTLFSLLASFCFVFIEFTIKGANNLS
jgi:hypothetical protein